MQHDSQAIHILRSAFTLRGQKNPRYSLRAFAKSLGLSHTVLSLVMSGKRPLSVRAAKIVAAKLALNPEQVRALTVRKAGTKPPERDYQQIEMDLFHLISDWVHYAILSLVEIETGALTAKQIAKRLNITEMNAKLCFERLLDLNLIRKQGERYVPTGLPLKVENSVSTAGSRKFQQQLLEKALESLQNDPFEIRDHSSMTMAIDPAQIPYARERIRQFRRELTEELEAKGKASEVYNLTVQIYPVSQRTKP